MDKQNKYKPVKHTKATTTRLLAADPELNTQPLAAESLLLNSPNPPLARN